jgi:hypothetical protein
MLIDASVASLYNDFHSIRDMALKGNLRDFSLTQLLNLVNLARKSGNLNIEGQSGESKLYFKQGKLAYAQYGREDNTLPAILQRKKTINDTQYRILLEKSSTMSDKELGLMLVNAGYLDQAKIIETLQQYFVEVIRKLFTWAEGFFFFDPDQLMPGNFIPVKIELENLIIEGSRQLKEMEQLQEEIPSLEMSLKFADRPGANIRKVNLSVDEWKVVSYVNPKNTMRQISQVTKMDDFQIRKVVYSLLQAGLVEIIRPGGFPILPRDKMFPTKNPDEQKSMLNRLITRIRAI